MGERLYILARGLVWGGAFVAVVLVYLPQVVVRTSVTGGTRAPAGLQAAGMLLVAAGIAAMASSFLVFVFRGGGTAAPFDPPRHLVVAGPYRWVRNPMYLGAMAALLGAALFWASPWLLAYLAAFAAWAHLFVTRFEEPRLRRTFGDAYDRYVRHVARWVPSRPWSPPPA